VPRRLAPLAILLCLAAGVWFPGCGGRDALLTDHGGYPVYRKHCRRCHGPEGDGARASRMADRTLDLGAAAFRDTMDADAAARVVRDGHGRMKGYSGKLSPAEVDAVVQYVLGMAEARRRERSP
jgi:mono/diheme cytochrome c family protein